MNAEFIKALDALQQEKGIDKEELIQAIESSIESAYRKNYGKVTGTPDIAITTCKIAIFVDGDFWHGWRFPQWRNKLSE